MEEQTRCSTREIITVVQVTYVRHDDQPSTVLREAAQGEPLHTTQVDWNHLDARLTESIAVQRVVQQLFSCLERLSHYEWN